jgi:hypothetical protein
MTRPTRPTAKAAPIQHRKPKPTVRKPVSKPVPNWMTNADATPLEWTPPAKQARPRSNTPPDHGKPAPKKAKPAARPRHR